MYRQNREKRMKAQADKMRRQLAAVSTSSSAATRVGDEDTQSEFSVTSINRSVALSVAKKQSSSPNAPPSEEKMKKKTTATRTTAAKRGSSRSKAVEKVSHSKLSHPLLLLFPIECGMSVLFCI